MELDYDDRIAAGLAARGWKGFTEQDEEDLGRILDAMRDPTSAYRASPDFDEIDDD